MKPVLDRERLGQLVRATWVAWAREQPDPKPHWLDPWEKLSEPLREVDRRIGEAIGDAVLEAAMGTRQPTSKELKINVQSGYGANTREPFVTITLPGPEPMVQLRAAEAEDLGLNLIRAAEGALTDGLIVEFFTKTLGVTLAETAPILNRMRAFRTQKSREGA